MEDPDTASKHDDLVNVDVAADLNSRRAASYLAWATAAQETDNEVADGHKVVKTRDGAFSENMQQFDSMIVEEVYVEFENNRLVRYRRIFSFADESDEIGEVIYKSLESPISCLYRYFCLCITGSGT